MTTLAMRRFLSNTCSIKKPVTQTGGKRGQSIEYVITSTQCSPLDPVTEEMRRRLELETYENILHCHVQESEDVAIGHVLVLSGREYPIINVMSWDSRMNEFGVKVLVVQDLQR